MKRMSNVNSLSAIIDRLIIENLKIIQFTDKNDIEKAEKQKLIIQELKKELDIIFKEISNKKYKSICEQRTYNSDNFFQDLFILCVNNYCISKYDKLKIEESKKSNSEINIKKLKNYIQIVRSNLESRAEVKNNIEKI